MEGEGEGGREIDAWDVTLPLDLRRSAHCIPLSHTRTNWCPSGASASSPHHRSGYPCQSHLPPARFASPKAQLDRVHQFWTALMPGPSPVQRRSKALENGMVRVMAVEMPSMAISRSAVVEAFSDRSKIGRSTWTSADGDTWLKAIRQYDLV